MDPTFGQLWLDARNELKKAKELLTAGETEPAKREAQRAAITGLYVLVHLDEKAAAAASADEIFKDWTTICSRPQDYIALAEKLLNHFAEVLGPENNLP